MNIKFSVKKIFLLIFFSFFSLPVFSQSQETFFWERNIEFSEKNSYFPVALYDENNAYVFFESVDKVKQEIKISWRHKKQNLSWSDTFSLSDTFKYSGSDIPDMYSAAISNGGEIAVSVLDASSENGFVRVYFSDNYTKSFSNYTFPQQEKQITSSRIFASRNGGFILFMSLGEGKQSPMESSFSILYSESKDGKSWSDLKVFKPSATISNAFSPFFTQLNGIDYVFFEGWAGKDSTTSLIYAASRSASSGNSWSEPFLVTDENSMTDSSSSYLDFKNFRPFVLEKGSEIKILWERTSKTSSSATVMTSSLSPKGKILDRNDVEALNPFGNGRRPSLFTYNDKFFALWFDDRNGINEVHLSEYLGAQWREVDSFAKRQNKKNPSSFPIAFVLPDKTSLAVAWQQENQNSDSIFLLTEDYFVQKPLFAGKNFKAGLHSNQKNPSVKILLPDDISGLTGFSWIFSSDKNAVLEKNIVNLNFRDYFDNVVSVSIPGDGNSDEVLYFKASVLDSAGNWSEENTLEYYYDVTPPEKIAEVSFETDEWGFASSNDVSFSWDADKTDEIAGYSWTLSKVAPLDKRFTVSKNKKLDFSPEESEKELAAYIEKNQNKLSTIKIPSAKVMSEKPEATFKNRDNGLYVFSVRAIDSVGNAGEVQSRYVVLNKYKAATQIKNVKAKTDDYGNISLSISGDEFSYDGKISEVIITRKETGEKLTLKESDGDFSLKKNSDGTETISDINLKSLKAGTYDVKIRHSVRGLSTWKNSLKISESGTVKYEKSYNFEPVWKILPVTRLASKVTSDKILFWIIITLIILACIVISRGIILTARDALRIKKDVTLILTGEYMAKEEFEKMEEKLRVQVSLKLKFGLLITSLLLLIVAGVALAIGYQMSKTQERILISGLKERVKTVMGNMSSGVQSYLDDGREKLVEIGAIVNQTDNFLEAEYATILSYEIDGNLLADGTRPLDYVWATNDENINRKINSTSFDAGTVRFESIIDEEYSSRCKKLNDDARLIVEDLSHTTGDNSNLIFRKLNEYSATKYDSYPVMSDEKLDRKVTNYYFYWPVIYQKGQNTDTLLQAMIVMEVSTDTLVKQIDESRQIVVSIAFVAAIIAAGIALISAFALSSIIVSPIRRIVAHVKRITDTADKLQLEGVEIRITSHDELRTLGDSVNDMTKGLVKGAKDEKRAKLAYERAAKDRERAARAQAEEAKARAESAEMNIMNLDGQAVQKAFIPLVSEGNEKETVAELKEKEIQVYGYYEGTEAVSGDYFDYKKLDDRWYAFIKCDASGHGVPAALIMTIVATIFRRYFANWKFEKEGVKLNLLTADINDFIESLGLRGKFAAMMICLLDTKTGVVYTCNAGDNILHVFDSNEKKIKVITLHEAPAAGPLPSFMVEMKGGYKVEKIQLKKNDVLFLYTDGIEESTRFFRNSDFEVIACDEEGLKEGEVHQTHKKGEKSEQMESHRVQDIIEAVLNRKNYVLTRYHSPIQNEKLEFNFSKCSGTIDEAIIALTAVEKVFRMYKKPDSHGKVEKTEMDLDGKMKTVIQISGDGIKIDRKIDDFLQKYFNRYDYYCVNKVDAGETNYIYYTGVSEDVQADDLTLLAIKKM